jgi:hypothetical protein
VTTSTRNEGEHVVVRQANARFGIHVGLTGKKIAHWNEKVLNFDVSLNEGQYEGISPTILEIDDFLNEMLVEEEPIVGPSPQGLVCRLLIQVGLPLKTIGQVSGERKVK